jgi:hypothetical protein
MTAWKAGSGDVAALNLTGVSPSIVPVSVCCIRSVSLFSVSPDVLDADGRASVSGRASAAMKAAMTMRMMFVAAASKKANVVRNKDGFCAAHKT